MSKYNIGDKVWYAKTETKEKTVTCPDCFGQKALTVIKGDGSQVSIECEGCRRGYEGSQGYVTFYEWCASACLVVIERVEETAIKTEYGFWNCYSGESDRFFDTKEEAEKKSLELSEEHNQYELDKINQKEKHNRTWSWNAHYHRDCIKRAERDLAYHTAKLSVAKIKAKEDKED